MTVKTMADEKKYDVFLSYSSKDREWVKQFVNAIQESGLTAWFDVADIPPGERWEDHIQKALRESTILVLIMSPDSIKSPWTYFELGAAIADQKRIIPVLTQEMDWRDIPTPLARLQFLKESSPWEAGVQLAQVVSQSRGTNSKQ